MAFHFTSVAPEQQVFADIQNLNAFNDGQFSQFVDIVLSFFISHSASDMMEKIAEFAGQHGVNVNALKGIVRGVLIFCRGALQEHLSPQFLKEDLLALGLNDDKGEVFSQLWKTNFVAMSRSAIGQTLVVNQVVDMQWRFGVATASDELQKVGSTFLQLKLVLDKGNNQRENVHMELTLPQFYQLLHDMEQAKAHLDYFL